MFIKVERSIGVKPTVSDWKPDVLPNYTTTAYIKFVLINYVLLYSIHPRLSSSFFRYSGLINPPRIGRYFRICLEFAKML